MASSALNLPIDIPWERVCVTTDMLDPANGNVAQVPPLWQSSIALFRYVPPDEYQVYPNRRLVYYKVTCTITSYQPRAEQVIGLLEAGQFGVTETGNDELQRRLSKALPCTAAVLHVSVSPAEQGRDLSTYPYFIDVQPRQRALYEQATDTKERASRTLGTVQVRKDAGTTNSTEVLDVDKGGGISAFGVGGQAAGEWGAKTLDKQDAQLIQTSDTSREARETQAFTTQLSQMYTLLQSYHVGTNRVVFYVTPRPHIVEPPTGILGPRALDGVQDFFLIASQAKGDELPCITIRLDTGHLHIQPQYDYDRSLPPKTLTVSATAPAPLANDPASASAPGGDALYSCFMKSGPPQQDHITADPGYIIENVTTLSSVATGFANAAVTNTTSVSPISPDGRQVTVTATATGYACHRQFLGDLINVATVGPLRHLGLEPASDSNSVTPGFASRTIRATFRSETPSVKVGEEYVLTLTTRQLRCCQQLLVIVPVIIAITPVLYVPAPAAEPATPPVPPRPGGGGTGTTTGTTAAAAPTSTFSLDAVNALQRRLGEETFRLSTSVDPAKSPSLEQAFLVDQAVTAMLESPRAQARLARPATELGLSTKELESLASAIGRSGAALTRADLLAVPNEIIASATQRSLDELATLRLSAAGLRVRTPDSTTTAQTPAQGGGTNTKPSARARSRRSRRSSKRS